MECWGQVAVGGSIKRGDHAAAAGVMTQTIRVSAVGGLLTPPVSRAGRGRGSGYGDRAGRRTPG